MQFLKHDKFEKEFSKIKYSNIHESLSAAERLLEKQFDSINPVRTIAPGKIHRVTSGADYEIWKLELIIKGLRPSQWPRVWFMVHINTITFLCVGLHQDNHDNNERDREAKERALDLLDF